MKASMRPAVRPLDRLLLGLGFLYHPLMWFSGALYPILVAIALRASYYSRVYRPPKGQQIVDGVNTSTQAIASVTLRPAKPYW